MTEKELIEEESEETEEEETIDLTKENKDVKTTMIIPRKTLKAIGHIAINEGVSKAEVIRKALDGYIEAHNPKVKADKEYADKVKRLLEAKKKLQEKDVEVELEDEDFLEPNIDKTIADLEKAFKESED